MKLKNLVFESSFERLKTNVINKDTALKAVSFSLLKDWCNQCYDKAKSHSSKSQLLRNFSISQTRSQSHYLEHSLTSRLKSHPYLQVSQLSKNLSLFSIFHIYKSHSVCYNITIEHHLYKKKGDKIK